MGIIKLYSGGFASLYYTLYSFIISTSTAGEQTASVPTVYDTSGNSYNTFYSNGNSTEKKNKCLQNIRPFVASGLRVFASPDDYSTSDYCGNSTGTSTVSVSQTNGTVTYTINFTADENTTIKCFKFTNIFWTSFTTGSDFRSLIFGYFFDEPISVTSGEQYIFTITMGMF